MNSIFNKIERYNDIIVYLNETDKKYWQIKFILPFYHSELVKMSDHIESMLMRIGRFNDCDIYYNIKSEICEMYVVIVPCSVESMVNLILSEESIIEEIKHKISFSSLLCNVIIDYTWYGMNR